MELWLLGAGVVVLIAITLLLVWPAQSAETTDVPVRNEEDTRMMPQGDEFEDQYTSATADLSAGGVATALTLVQVTETAAPLESPYGAVAEAWSSPTIAHEGIPATPGSPTSVRQSRPARAAVPRSQAPIASSPPAVGLSLGLAVLLVLVGAVCGAWLYARWQSRRNAPMNRLRRSLRKMRGQLR